MIAADMTLRVLYNYILVLLGIRRLMPRDIVNRVVIRECGEPMVGLPEEDIIVAPDVVPYGRAQVIEKLAVVSRKLETLGLRLQIFELYRPAEKQAGRRKDCRAWIVAEHPDYSEQQVESTLNKMIAGIGGGHQSGGAVDLTLCDREGRPIDMGTGYLEHNDSTATDSKHITSEQQRNRRILLNAMKQAGFVNYPAEWWHFAYGDRMWAAYKHKRHAIYGNVTFTNPHQAY